MRRRVLALGPLMSLWALSWVSSCGTGDSVVVGSKNFTESILLGELVAQKLEEHNIAVDRRFNLGGSFICHNAQVNGQLDIYVEYTGTAYTAILEMSDERHPERVRAIVDSVYAERWNLIWAEPLGFDNTFAMLVRGEDARRLNVHSISEAIPHIPDWRLGAGYEFIERADGLRGLQTHYGVVFSEAPTELDLGLTYRALAEGRVDIIAGNSTDGQIDALDLYHLSDDRGYFPPYEAVPIVRAATLERFPQMMEALLELAGAMSEAEMRRLNMLVDVERMDVREVAADFLRSLPEINN
ncbi:glycine betaine ABC transporter substrate-binding protein [Gemmatimonadota bacterium]